jgi:hypothetical protein
VAMAPCYIVGDSAMVVDSCECRLTLSALNCFLGLPGGGLSPAGHAQRNQANLTAGGPWQNLTSEIRLTPLSQEVLSA